MKRWVALALAASLAVGCHGRPRAQKQSVGDGDYGAGTLLEIDLSHGVPESTEGNGWLPLPASRTLVGLVRALEKARQDSQVTGVYVNLGDVRLHLSQVEELAPLFSSLRNPKRTIVCHADGLDNGLYSLATQGCDRIWLSPAGEIENIGIAAQSMYIKSLLDEFKVEADFLSIGRFKSAAEMFTRDGPSDEARLALTATLGSIRQAWLEGIAHGRATAGAHAEEGPLGATEAKALGLVDALGDSVMARRDAKRRARAGKTQHGFGPNKEEGSESGIAEILRALAGSDSSESGKPYIAVVPAIGGITMRSDNVLSGEGITYDSLAKTIMRLSQDDAARAVVLRIDSPGGSALASDLLWLRLRELGAKKPLIAAVGSMAASGGYYLASAAKTIVAERTSIVGSIGVLGGKIVFGAALDAHGVHTVTTPASIEPGAAARAAYLSPFTPWDDATRVRLRSMMTQVYDLFVQRVAEGRQLTDSQVREIAEGRIWSGVQGKERGLVDEFGGLPRALEIARKLSGLGSDAAIRVEGPAEGLLAALGLGAHATAEDISLAIERQRKKLWSPIELAPHAIVPWLAGTTPLLGSEKILALWPDAITVQ